MILFTVKLAWRNIWRQKRRTWLTASAIGVAMLLALFMRSMQEGSYARNVDNSTRLYSGLVQLQELGFFENKSIDHLLPGDQGFEEKIKQIPGLRSLVPRLESFALAAAGDKSKGVVVMGILPSKEDAYSHVAKYLQKGKFFKEDSEVAAIMGEGLARSLGLEVGGKVVLYGQGYHGTTAAAVYPVGGILKYPSAPLDARLLYLPLPAAQALFGTGNQVTAWVLHGEPGSKSSVLKKAAQKMMPAFVRVQTWEEISPELAQQITLDRVGGQFIVFILYGVVGFGLFGTLVMMTLERKREFAVMLATGMVRRRLQFLVVVESFFLSVVGVLLGGCLTLPVLLWFHFHPIRLTGDYAAAMRGMGWDPILPMSLDPGLFLTHGLMVLGLFFLSVIYPLVRIHRMPLAASLKG